MGPDVVGLDVVGHDVVGHAVTGAECTGAGGCGARRHWGNIRGAGCQWGPTFWGRKMGINCIYIIYQHKFLSNKMVFWTKNNFMPTTQVLQTIIKKLLVISVDVI